MGQGKGLSLTGILWFIGAGIAVTSFALCVGIFFAVRNVAAVIACLVTSAVLSVWPFVLVRVLRNRMAYFTDELCRKMETESVTN